MHYYGNLYVHIVFVGSNLEISVIVIVIVIEHLYSAAQKSAALSTCVSACIRKQESLKTSTELER